MLNIAFLGVGLMGRPMAGRLIDAGHRLFLFNRTRHKILDLKDRGAVIADSAADAIQQSSCVMLMLSDYNAIQDVLFHGETVEFSGRTFIQMGTILPEESRQLKARIEAEGASYFECPVLGSRDKAEIGELILMAGSTAEQFEQFKPVLNVLGHSLRHIGEVGKATALKLALNQLIVSLAGVFSLSLGIVLKEKIRSDDFMAILKESVLYAETFDKKLPRILSDDFSNPNFPVRHMLKDIRLILKQAAHNGLELSVLQAFERILLRAMDSGYADEDYSAIARVIHSRS